MKTRQEIKALAREGMAYQRGTAILIALVYILVVLAGGQSENIPVLGSIILLATLFFIDMPLLVGMYGTFIKIFSKEQTGVGEMFSGGFAVNYLRKVGGMAWMLLWVIIWSLLLVIPGIVKALSYSMTAFILHQFPNVTARQALKISMKITDGYKGDIFVLTLSFIGWLLLFSIPSFILWGIGLHMLSSLVFHILFALYVSPYLYTSFAGFYLELRDKALADGKVTHEELGLPAPVPVHEPMIIH